jgi:hypothetical protein
MTIGLISEKVLTSAAELNGRNKHIAEETATVVTQK